MHFLVIIFKIVHCLNTVSVTLDSYKRKKHFFFQFSDGNINPLATLTVCDQPSVAAYAKTTDISAV